MAHGEDDGRERDEAHVGEASDDEQELRGRSAVIIEVVNGDDVRSPR